MGRHHLEERDAVEVGLDILDSVLHQSGVYEYYCEKAPDSHVPHYHPSFGTSYLCRGDFFPTVGKHRKN